MFAIVKEVGLQTPSFPKYLTKQVSRRETSGFNHNIYCYLNASDKIKDDF